jgi:conserved oligomeric Golgi complex subunit 5
VSFFQTAVVQRCELTQIVTRTSGVARNAIRTFVLNASIIKPLGEAGKLQLTSDMTELEFSLGSFVADSGRRKSLSLDALGDDYRILRALR